MLFNSWHFAVFFPTVAILHFLLPYRQRWMLLLVASYVFYMFSVPAYALLLVVSTLIDYSLGRAMARTGDRRTRIRYLVASLTSNLGLLFTFKYFNFFAESFEALGQWVGVSFVAPHSDLILPVGISFYTFQTLSYSIDVFRGRHAPEKHLGRYALFVAFFPQLVAGPIERSSNLLPQIREKHDFDYERIAGGLKLMGWGLFKKVVVADHLATLVNAVYNEPSGLVGFHFTLATLFFAFQIYCDFSGYSDMAIGAAQVLGYRLMINFDRPYLARSISDFWSRWHISLSSWFRDYLYIPLGGSRVAVPRWYLNLLIVFLISGLWHGAQWTFVIWGALHGGYLVFALATRPHRERMARSLGLERFGRLHSLLQGLTVFGLVCFAWIFFRANSLGEALYAVSHLGEGWSELLQPGGLRLARKQMGVSDRYLATAGILIVSLLIAERKPARERGQWRNMFAGQHWSLRWSFYAAVVLAVINLGAPKQQPFLYFQF